MLINKANFIKQLGLKYGATHAAFSRSDIYKYVRGRSFELNKDSINALYQYFELRKQNSRILTDIENAQKKLLKIMEKIENGEFDEKRKRGLLPFGTRIN